MDDRHDFIFPVMHFPANVKLRHVVGAFRISHELPVDVKVDTTRHTQET